MIITVFRNDITTLAFYGHGSEAILFFSMWQGKVIHAISLGYFAMKFDLLMFSNIFDTISKFTVELKVYFLLFNKQQQQNGRQCKHAIFLIKTSFKEVCCQCKFIQTVFLTSLFGFNNI